MKKLALLLFSAIIATTISVTAIAASSPSGPVIDDKYDFIGEFEDEKYSGTIVTIGDTTIEVGDDGTFKIENITEGTHKIVFSKDSNVFDEITINVIVGDETKSVKISDDVYNVYVKKGVSTIYVNFKAESEKDIVIEGANSVGNDSPNSPPTGDNTVNTICLALLVAFSGIVVSGYFKKRYN